MASSATRLVGAVRAAAAGVRGARGGSAALRCARRRATLRWPARRGSSSTQRCAGSARQFARCAAPGGGQLGGAARRRCAAPGGDAARRRAAPGGGGAMTSREGGVDDGSSGVAHPARPARTGSAHDRGWLKAR
jgi:hypothetical protein